VREGEFSGLRVGGGKCWASFSVAKKSPLIRFEWGDAYPRTDDGS
jgi:hypothetical protein